MLVIPATPIVGDSVTAFSVESTVLLLSRFRQSPLPTQELLCASVTCQSAGEVPIRYEVDNTVKPLFIQFGGLS